MCVVNGISDDVHVHFLIFTTQSRELTRAHEIPLLSSLYENEVSPLLRPTERLAERETLLYSLGFKLNRIVSNSCGNPIIRVTFAQCQVHTKKEAKKGS